MFLLIPMQFSYGGPAWGLWVHVFVFETTRLVYTLAQEDLIQGGRNEFQEDFSFEPPVSDFKKKKQSQMYNTQPYKPHTTSY